MLIFLYVRFYRRHISFQIKGKDISHGSSIVCFLILNFESFKNMSYQFIWIFNLRKLPTRWESITELII